MPTDDTDLVRTWKEDPVETHDDDEDDEDTADGMVDDDDVFDAIAWSASPGGRPESSWDAVVENISRVRQGNA